MKRTIGLILRRFWKRTLPQTLFARSMMILVLPFILTMTIGVFVFFDRHWSTTTFRLVDSLAGEVALITDTWDQEESKEAHDRLITSSRNKLGISLQFLSREKLPKTRNLNVPGISKPLIKSLESKLNRPFTIKPSRDREFIIITTSVNNGLLQLYVPQKRLFSTTTYVFLLIMLGSGLILSLIAVVFMRNQIRPVKKLAEVVDQFGKGIDTPRFKPSGAKEVRQAAIAFLEMRDRIKRQIKQRTDMLSGVSHDLKTPLTRLKLQLAMLPENHDTHAMQNDILAMEKMIKAYLDFARDESLEYRLKCNIIDLLQQAIHEADKQHLKISWDAPDVPIIINIRPQAILRVFTNLLDNIRLYAGQGWISVAQLARSVEIHFDDNGPGISPSHYEDVFKPFHRLDESRNQDIEGTGLGLTIARDIIQSHGGTIELNRSSHGGLRVTIGLPL